MALTKALVREILSSAGVDSDHMSEAVSKIIDGNVTSIEALREEISKLKEENGDLKAKNLKLKEEADKIPEIKKELEDLKKQVEDDKAANADKDYDKLKAEFDAYKDDVQKKAVRMSKEAAFKEILKDAGIPEKHYAKIIKYSDIDGLELDDKGKVKDPKEILKSIKEEWDDHIEKTSERGAETENPPHNNGGSGMTKEKIMQIKDTSERQKAISENPDLFGIK